MACILIIDDEDLFRVMLRKFLEREGHTVVEAADGKEAIQKYKEATVDLVITDILMPERDGIETIVSLRREHPHLKIIAVSGGGDTGKLDFLPAAQHLGAVRTFKKPFDRREFLDAVSEILAEGEEQA